MKINFYLNNEFISLDISPHLKSHNVLEPYCKKNEMSGNTKFDHGFILLNGQLTNSQLLPSYCLNRQKIWTFSGLKNSMKMQKLVQRLEEENIVFCSNCYANQMLLLIYLLRQARNVYSEVEWLYKENMDCSCTPYMRVFQFLRNAKDEDRKW